MTDAEKIKILRKHYHLTQPKFGEKLGVTSDIIGNIEQGRTKIKPLMAKLICDVYNVEPVWINTGKENMIANYNFAKLKKEYKLTEKEINILKTLIELPNNKREVIAQAIDIIMNCNF